jgi:hypothetical protein
MREVVQPYSLLQQSSHANKTSIHKNSQTSPLYVHFRFPNIVDGEGNVGSPLRSAFSTKIFSKNVIDITVCFRVLCYLNANPMFMLDQRTS